MQNAKDTFYTTLQGRLAALNPARTIVLRGLERPGTLVEENELPTAAAAVDAFRLQWTGLQVTSASPLPWVAMECSIEYATDGSPNKAGMDRGRLLAAMDAELAAALGAEPHAVAKMNYAAAGVGRCAERPWAQISSGPIRSSARPQRWASACSGRRRSRSSRTRKRVSCEYNDDSSGSGGGRGSGNAAGARVLCPGESRGRCANVLRSGAD